MAFLPPLFLIWVLFLHVWPEFHTLVGGEGVGFDLLMAAAIDYPEPPPPIRCSLGRVRGGYGQGRVQ